MGKKKEEGEKVAISLDLETGKTEKKTQGKYFQKYWKLLQSGQQVATERRSGERLNENNDGRTEGKKLSRSASPVSRSQLTMAASYFSGSFVETGLTWLDNQTAGDYLAYLARACFYNATGSSKGRGGVQR